MRAEAEEFKRQLLEEADAEDFNKQLREMSERIRRTTAEFKATWDKFIQSPEGIQMRREDEEREAARLADWNSREHRTDDDEAMTPGTARCIRRDQWLLSEARLFKLAEPIEYDGEDPKRRTRFVMVSRRSFETMAFAADSNGELVPEGHYTSVSCVTGDHASAVEALGFAVTDRGDGLPLVWEATT